MEIELSWPAWLQKVLLLLLEVLVLASVSHQLYVASMDPSGVQHSTNSSSRTLHSQPAVADVQTSKMRHDWSIFSENQQQKMTLNSTWSYSNVENSLDETRASPLTNLNEPPIYTNEVAWETDLSDIRIQESAVIFNESFWDLLECDDFDIMDLPPSFIDLIPPPPIPPFLSDKEILLNLNDEDFSQSNKIAFDNQFCTLCSWSKTGVNMTTLVQVTEIKETKKKIGRTMIATLIGVAVLSAAVGATLMAVLFKCRKQRTQTQEGAHNCPLVIYCRRWVSTSTHKIHHQGNSPTSRSKNDPESSSTAAESGERSQRTIALRLWKGCSNTAGHPPSGHPPPILQTSSPDSENSYYTEEHYISGDTGSSVVYAELASHCNTQQVESPPTSTDQHHYSEIEDMCRLSNQKRDSSDETYENFSYISSSTRPNDGSIYSTNPSVPSSAYYSDLSSCELYNIERNQRNKRKRKRNVRSNSERSYPFVVSSMTQTNPVLESRVANIHPLHLTQHQHKCIPETLQIINNTNQLVDPTRFTTQTPLEGLAITNVSELQNYVRCNQVNNFKGNTVPCGDTHGIDLYELNSNHCIDDSAIKSLPQLPYRQMSFPNTKRHLRALIQAQDLASVPSEYI